MTNTCNAFEWIGKPLTSCDGCGRPYWEHSHESRSTGPILITPEHAEAVKAKWLRSEG